MLAKMPTCSSTESTGWPLGAWHFRNAFQGKLPVHVRNGLVDKAFSFLDLTEYLKLADKLYDSGKAAQTSATVASVDDTNNEVGAVGKAPGAGKAKAKPERQQVQNPPKVGKEGTELRRHRHLP